MRSLFPHPPAEKHILLRSWQAHLMLLLFMVGLVLTLLYWSPYQQGDSIDEMSIAPSTNEGQKWRIGYYESGPWPDYVEYMRGTVRGLMKIGWIKEEKLPPRQDTDNGDYLWKWLAKKAESDYLEFVPQAYWSANWNDEARPQIRAEVLKGLQGPKKLDLILALGTWAGQDLANDKHQTPTLVMSVSDPVEAGIIPSPNSSFHEHVHAICTPDKYIRQVRMFHYFCQFKRLGVACGDTHDSRMWNNIADLKRVAKECGFEVIEIRCLDDSENPEASRESVMQALKENADKFDAFWIGSHAGLKPEFMPEVLEYFMRHKVPTWAQFGQRAVQKGALLGMGEADFNRIGLFEARVLAQVLNGTPPAQINQSYEKSKRLTINLETARRIGYNPPKGLLKVCDRVFEHIATDAD